jgi:hypothetical protein
MHDGTYRAGKGTGRAPLVPENAPLVPENAPLVPGDSCLVPEDASSVPENASLVSGNAPLVPGNAPPVLEDEHRLKQVSGQGKREAAEGKPDGRLPLFPFCLCGVPPLRCGCVSDSLYQIVFRFVLPTWCLREKTVQS